MQILLHAVAALADASAFCSDTLPSGAVSTVGLCQPWFHSMEKENQLAQVIWLLQASPRC
ncbi:MAG: hypothetical protein WCN98_02985 [Verrucomicrobiaceae bacterium]